MIALQKWWQTLPQMVQRGLLLGAEGSVHLMGLAQQTLQQAMTGGPQQAVFLKAGVDFLRAAWAKDMLNGQLAEQLLTLHGKWPCLGTEIRSQLQAVLENFYRPENLRYYRRLVEGRESEKLRHFLGVQLEREKSNLYWWRQALVLAQFEENWELAARVVAADWPAVLTPVRRQIEGDLAWLQGKRDDAFRCYGEACGLDAKFRQAMMLAGTDGLETSRPLWREILTEAPWMTQAVLVCHDLLRKVGQARHAPRGAGVIALYSFNKVDELDLTLGSVAASALGDARIWVLDNGSSDGTVAMLQAWQERLGDRMRGISLPVNVGAPAARNWLLHEGALEGVPWMVYVDDDVEVPADWLSLLGAAMQAYPEAGVWGCKVVDAAAPVVVQSVDLHLLPAAEPDGQDIRFKVADLHHQTRDFGQFDYLRPCASVTGCCHLFLMDRLRDIGDFDLRFSPSQYDDLEHDIRLNMRGQYAVYQGHLRILHMKRTGKSTMIDAAQLGSASANMHKLQKKYSRAEYEHIMAWEADVLARDFWAKYTAVTQWLERGR